ncbi:hypothetical protein [Bacillus mycoides]|uniref:hypothetical protein n=1 Tax=Bacillus mycoides TaxID=1405 RepID=UPI00103D0718|nr:hypothetical protein [Bacillus mycoides]
MIVRYHRISKLHNIFQNTYLIELFVMHIFGVVIGISKNPHIYLLGTLSLMKWVAYQRNEEPPRQRFLSHFSPRLIGKMKRIEGFPFINGVIIRFLSIKKEIIYDLFFGQGFLTAF